MENPVKNSFGRIFNELRNIWTFVKRVVFKITHLADDTDVEGTIKDIKGGIVLEGSNLWVLMCSAAIACIGLDTNSPAIIIGAMLISPLMSPILGIGLSAGINDKEYLVKSIYNFSVATGLSLLTAFIYFKVTPLGEITDQMRGRVSPTILDAGVALFGGLAGIIAGSRTEKTNAIPGVAIATALMPPVCTAGFGLATGDMDIFLGAFYLFLINAILISLATYAIVRMLRFPLVQDEDAEWAPRIRVVVFGVIIPIMLLPSYLFLRTTLKDIQKRELISEFISKHIHEDVNKGVDWNIKELGDSVSRLEVYYFGEYIKPDSTLKLLDTLTQRFSEIDVEYKWRLQLTPTDAPPDEKKKELENSLTNVKQDILKIQSELSKQRYETDSLKGMIVVEEKDTIPFNNVQVELKALYPDLEQLALGKLDQTVFDSSGVQGYFTAILKWNKPYSTKTKKYRANQIGEFLKVKLHIDQIEVVTK